MAPAHASVVVDRRRGRWPCSPSARCRPGRARPGRPPTTRSSAHGRVGPRRRARLHHLALRAGRRAVLVARRVRPQRLQAHVAPRPQSGAGRLARRTSAGRRDRPSTWPGACRRAARRCASPSSTRASAGAIPARWPTWPRRPTSTSGEAQPPCWPAVADGDCNHDGVFNITDFGAIPDLNHNGVADPEDLILNPTYNNGHDDDHDGYVDDISGWDFLYGDNDPLDTVDYGHGTGEAKDSTRGRQRHRRRRHLSELPVHPGPRGRLVHRRRRPVRGRACCSGSTRVPTSSRRRSAALNDPRQAQEAIDAAYHRGVVVVASMADEASKHPNLPGVARAHDGRELGDDVDQQPARRRHERRATWPSTAAPTSAATPS